MTEDRDHTKRVLFAAAAVMVLFLLANAVRSLVAGAAPHPNLTWVSGVPAIVTIAFVASLWWYAAEPYWRVGCLVLLLGIVSPLATFIAGPTWWLVSAVVQLTAAGLSGFLFAVSWFKRGSLASAPTRKESVHRKVFILCTFILAIALILLLYGLR